MRRLLRRGLLAGLIVCWSFWVHAQTQPISAQQQRAIDANAAMVRDALGPQSGVDFGFTPASIAWLDGYIERVRGSGVDATRLAQTLGSYLGETIRHTHGGHWVQADDSAGVEIAPGFVVYPFNKVHKQLANGPEDSIQSLYTAIGPLLAQHGSQRSGK